MLSQPLGTSTGQLTTFHLAAQLIGTPNYLAPEAWEQGGAGVSFPADVWSFGCCMVEAGAGRMPFGGQNIQGIRRLLVSVPPSLIRLLFLRRHACESRGVCVCCVCAEMHHVSVC
eukprot:3722423-Rhodomonas_salina.1